MSAATASPAERSVLPRETDKLKYPDLTPPMLGVLRLDAALSETYGDKKSQAILEGHKAWRMKTSSRTPEVGNMASRDRSQTSRGVQ